MQESFTSVLNACSHTKKTAQALQLFNSMQNFDIIPEETHYTCIVDALGQAGKLDEAENFMKNMKVQPTIITLHAILRVEFTRILHVLNG